MEDSFFDAFTLVGGTALSLIIGHRISIDLDFFTITDFNAQSLAKHLQTNYSFELDYLSKNTIKGESKGIQLDFIAHQYPLVEYREREDGIRLSSITDIAAMKLNAITTNGTRIKDFIDIAFLSSFLTLNKMLEAYEKKYSANRIIALKSLIYFDDINIDEPVNFTDKAEISWEIVKKQILSMIQKPDLLFE